MEKYEILYILPASYAENELDPIKDKVKNLIVKAGGEITASDSLGKKKLAYPIKKAFQGYYLLYEFKLEPEKLTKLNIDLKLTNEVLRHFIVKTTSAQKSMLEITKARAAADQKAKDMPTTEEQKTKDKIKLEDLDKKLDEILSPDVM